MQSRFADLGGKTHYVDFGGEGPPIVLVHGLGGSHANWLGIAPRLARHGHVYALDLAGFGRTPPEGRGSEVPANRALLDAFLERVVQAPALLVGNSMGGLISIFEAAHAP